ncbi:DUF1059 domain-containing protein [Nocardioides humi]|uniref:DUF1059 domain-containing protein n=1 Tax=Nocardioides humi TaxID=449461 RepID=A0ABN2BDV8_9ACTN|nr:DUF1059 domain-containing protein [Nocardioides humi]
MSDQNQNPTLRLDCPCGARLQGPSEDELVEAVQAHLAQRHPGREYSREEILFLAF